MDAEQTRGPRLIALGAVEHAPNKPLLKFIYSFIEQDPALHHLAHQGLELISHDARSEKSFGPPANLDRGL